MCGIGGWIGERDDKALARMQAALRHRGPDDAGQHVSDYVSLFHQRLSIIDLDGGRQPISNEDGTLWIVSPNSAGRIFLLRINHRVTTKGKSFTPT